MTRGLRRRKEPPSRHYDAWLEHEKMRENQAGREKKKGIEYRGVGYEMALKPGTGRNV